MQRSRQQYCTSPPTITSLLPSVLRTQGMSGKRFRPRLYVRLQIIFSSRQAAFRTFLRKLPSLVSTITVFFPAVCVFIYGLGRGIEEVTFHKTLCHGLALPLFAHALRLA
jgi:hypothetical protein